MKIKSRTERMMLKNGVDLAPGEERPLSGRQMRSLRAYELLVKKTDEEYLREAEAPRRVRRDAVRPLQAAQDVSENAQLWRDPQAEKLEEQMKSEWTVPEKEFAAGKQRRLKIAVAVILVIALGVFARLRFGEPLLFADISSYGDVEIEIEGLTEEPFTVTPKELSKLKKEAIQVDVHVGEVAAGEVPEQGKALGPTLDEFLRSYANGKTAADFRSMKVYSEKGTSTAYVRTLKEEKIILSIANGNKALGEKQAPLRIAVEGENPGEWSGWIRRIVFTPEN